MAPKIAAFLKIVSDGRWHTLEGIRKKTELSVDQVEQIVRFLVQYALVTRDAKGNRIRIDEAFRKFLAQEATP